MATRIAKANRRRDSKPEVALRSALHRSGLRFRKDHLIETRELRVRADVVFARSRVAVFVDGCFWHGCRHHQRVPQTNREYWVPKLQANVERDRRVTAALREDGWVVVRIWEHEPVERAAAVVLQALAQFGG